MVDLKDEIYDNTASTYPAAIGEVTGSGAFSNCLNGGLSIPDAAQLHFGTDSFSISFWFKTPSDLSTFSVRVANTVNFNDDKYFLLSIGYSSDSASNTIAIFAADSSVSGIVQYYATTSAFSSGTWTHFVVVFDRSEESAICYINGTEVLSPILNTWISFSSASIDSENNWKILPVVSTGGGSVDVSFISTADQTYSFWLKTDVTETDTTGFTEWLYPKFSEFCGILVEDNDVFLSYTEDYDKYQIPNDDTWRHYAVKFHTYGTSPKYFDAYLYEDGVLVDSVTGSEYTGSDYLFKSVVYSFYADYRLGDNVYMDEIQIYNRILDDAEIVTLATEGTATTPLSGCIAQYSFDAGFTLEDSSGNGNHINVPVSIAPGKFIDGMQISAARDLVDFLELDEVQIYNRALSSAEVLQLYGS